MSQFIGTTMPAGFAGDITRGQFDHTTEIRINDKSAPVKAFGVPVKLTVDGKAVTPTTAGADALLGFSVRAYGQAGVVGEEPAKTLAVLRRGYMAVVTEGTPKVGGKVYLSASGKVTAESGGSTAIANCSFMGTKDADGLVEIAFNI